MSTEEKCTKATPEQAADVYSGLDATHLGVLDKIASMAAPMPGEARPPFVCAACGAETPLDIMALGFHFCSYECAAKRHEVKAARSSGETDDPREAERELAERGATARFWVHEDGSAWVEVKIGDTCVVGDSIADVVDHITRARASASQFTREAKEKP
jgi:hypothetical protein